MTRFALRAYGVLLYLYPPGLRHDHGVDMRLCARDAVAAHGPRVLPSLFLDLAISLPREWLLLLKGFSMTGAGRDVAYALRLLRRSPGFSAAAIVTLALGIGANTAIFTLADATIIRPLRVAALDRLVAFKWSASLPDYRDWATRTDVFTGVAAVANVVCSVSVDGVTEPIDTAFVSANYFPVLGVGASAGRLLGAGDDPGRGDIAVVIDSGWWRSRFGADPAAIGKTIHVSGTPVTIVGVAADAFRGTSLTRLPMLYLPVTSASRLLSSPFNAPNALENRGMVWMNVIARLRDGVPAATAAQAMNVMYARQHPEDRDALIIEPLKTRVLGGTGGATLSTFISLLAGVVALTLLIGCANIANLQLARAAARQREIGVRLAIGAGRSRIFQQLLTESLVLAAIGGVLGLEVASLSLRLIARFQLPGGINIAPLTLHVNGAALGFAIVVSAATVLLFGLVPAWQAARGAALGAIRGESRTTTRGRLRSTLVAVQIALSLVLLTGTGLFLQSFAAAMRVPLGFVPSGAVTTSVTSSVRGFDRARAKAFFDGAVLKAHQIPGVTAAAWASFLPTGGNMSMDATVEGYQKKPREDTHVYVANVGPEYFSAAGIRLIRGRTFLASDTATAPLVGIVNETTARRFWAGRDPLQGRVMVDDVHFIQIVGVVEDTKIRSLDEKPAPYMYAPFEQPTGFFAADRGMLLVRTSGDVRALMAILRDQLRALDPAAPLSSVTTFEWYVRGLVMPQRMGATFFGAFALLALTLAAIGIYGVASYVAALRTREIGIRIALGADRPRIRSLVLRQAAVPLGAGIAAGLIAAAFASRLAAAFLRGISPRDPLTYIAVTFVLLSVAAAATWIPARRAARVDPVQALRAE